MTISNEEFFHLVESFAKTITYKSESIFFVTPPISDYSELVPLVILLAVLESTDCTTKTTVSQTVYFDKKLDLIDQKLNLAMAKQKIYEAIVYLEMHEVQEFLKFRNQNFINPHPVDL